MKALKLTSLIENGKLNPVQGKILVAWLSHLNGKTIELTASLKKKRRSIKQNDFFHGAFMDAAFDMFKECGSPLDREQCKEALKKGFGKKTSITMPGMTGYIPQSTADYTSGEMEEFMDKIRAWASDFGYHLPTPNEHLES